MKKPIKVVLICLAASAASAGTDAFNKGHYRLAANAGTAMWPFSTFVYGGDGVVISLRPEFGYFFANNFTLGGELGYWAFYDFDHGDYDSFVQFGPAVEYDAPLGNTGAFFVRFAAGVTYTSGGSDDVDAYFAPGIGGKVFIAPQTAMTFGYRPEGYIEFYGGHTDTYILFGFLYGFEIYF